MKVYLGIAAGGLPLAIATAIVQSLVTLATMGIAGRHRPIRLLPVTPVICASITIITFTLVSATFAAMFFLFAASKRKKTSRDSVKERVKKRTVIVDGAYPELDLGIRNLLFVRRTFFRL